MPVAESLSLLKWTFGREVLSPTVSYSDEQCTVSVLTLTQFARCRSHLEMFTSYSLLLSFNHPLGSLGSCRTWSLPLFSSLRLFAFLSDSLSDSVCLCFRESAFLRACSSFVSLSHSACLPQSVYIRGLINSSAWPLGVCLGAFLCVLVSASLSFCLPVSVIVSLDG